MLRELIVWLKIRPLLKKMGVLMSMTLNWSRFLQILAVVMQILNLLLPVVPPGGKVWVTVGIGIIQVLLHDTAGNNNPDGTNSATNNSVNHQ